MILGFELQRETERKEGLEERNRKRNEPWGGPTLPLLIYTSPRGLVLFGNSQNSEYRENCEEA